MRSNSRECLGVAQPKVLNVTIDSNITEIHFNRMQSHTKKEWLRFRRAFLRYDCGVRLRLLVRSANEINPSERYQTKAGVSLTPSFIIHPPSNESP